MNAVSGIWKRLMDPDYLGLLVGLGKKKIPEETEVDRSKNI